MDREIVYPMPSVRKETLHTLSYVRPALEPGDRILDIGCGDGWVLGNLIGDGHDVMGVDIVDLRKPAVPEFAFALYDGEKVPLPDASFDVVLLTFVLHHVPNDKKAPLVAEARRLTRRTLVVLEDTPRNLIDRWACNIHGRSHRKRIGTTADFGFYPQWEWEQFFVDRGFAVRRSEALPRFSRDVIRPWARCCFVLDKL